MPGELLELACRRITDLDRPAYVKNSDLRYVAVNDAYARFFGRDISDFIGRRSVDIFDARDEHDREDKERRALVFDTEEIAVRFDARNGAPVRVQIERFMTSEQRTYVFGVFFDEAGARAAEPQQAADPGSADLARLRDALEDAPHPIGVFAEDGRPILVNAAFRAQESAAAAQPLAAHDQAASDALLLRSVLAESTFDLMDVGVCVYSECDRLIYANDAWCKIYRRVFAEAPIGKSQREICEAIVRYWQVSDPGQLASIGMSPEDWVEGRLAAHRQPFSETTERYINGGWQRNINKRLPNGLLVGLRIDVTDLKEQEIELRKHIEEIGLYRTVLEDLPTAVFMRDEEHRLVYANAAYEAITGFSRAEIIGKTEHEMFTEGVEDLFTENERALKEMHMLKRESAIHDVNGVERPIVTHIRGATTSNSRYVLGSVMDIAALKEREQSLIKAQALADSAHHDLKNVLDSVPVGIMMLNAEHRVEYANARYYEMWDFPADDPLEGKTLRDLFAAQLKLGRYSSRALDELYQERLKSLAAAPELTPSEIVFEDGKVLVIHPRRISNGRMLLAYVDISSLRKREREITAARDELALLGELMNDTTHAMSQGLMIVQDGTVLLSNGALAKLLQVPAELVAEGEQWIKAFDHCAARGDFGDGPMDQPAIWLKSIEARRPISTVFRAAGKRWVQLEARLSDGDRWIFVLTEVTEFKERGEELQRLLSRSEAADRAKSEFVANMSHEIRTPMNGVLGMAELLAKTNLDVRQKTFVDVIVKSGNALLTIINDILDFSKIDARQMSLRRVPFDPAEAIEDVMTLLSSHAAEKNLELLVRLSPEVPQMVVGDPGRFRQIVTNLVGNAIKFTERGHILVTTSYQAAEDGEGTLMLTVEDTGIGIPDDRLGTIFDKFSQVDSSSTRRHEGTGLGLAITAGLVDLFGGKVSVRSEAGQGSMFTLSLPLPQSGANRPKSVPMNVLGARVLVIDDNAINRQILAEQLRMWGFDGVAAEDGPTGLAVLDAAFTMGVTVDAVILDYHMPGMNGVAVARAILEDSRFDSVALIFLTSMDVTINDREFSLLSGQAYLTKPARSNVLRNTVVDVVRAARSRRVQDGSRPAAALQTAAPLPAPAEPVAAPAAEPVKAPAKKPAAGVEILVAEDNEVNQIVFTQILQGLGRTFLVVDNGQKAVDTWRELQPLVIMMDVSMPEMNGHEATRTIRRIEAEEGIAWHTPIIGVTAHALDSHRDLCFEVGMDDYMSKPISPELLEAKIERWLDDATAMTGLSNG